MTKVQIGHAEKHEAGRVMQHLSLAWRSLAEKNFVKSANAVAKLDLSKAPALLGELVVIFRSILR